MLAPFCASTTFHRLKIKVRVACYKVVLAHESAVIANVLIALPIMFSDDPLLREDKRLQLFHFIHL